ncbi:MAG: C40 family peptidase [Legionella sp.]|nr:C40 family peptidase [Legionella sp.]
MLRKSAFFLLVLFSSMIFALETDNSPQTISTKELVDFESNPPKVKLLIEKGLQLTQKKLTYRYGSADPSLQGMDCSGTVYYLLAELGLQSVPRSSNNLYDWIVSKGYFYPVSQGMDHLHPGDLLFWTGTYAAPNNAYVTHVMIYMGKNKAGEPLMLGASNGRTYKGKKIYGVSVFNFLTPSSSSNDKFIGYGCIPQLSCSS